MIECMDKCDFTAADSYPNLVPGRPRYELLTTYTVVKKARKLLQAGNDNIRNAMDTYKIDVPMLRGAPLHWIPAWSNAEFGLQRSDGLLLGVDWTTMHFTHQAGLRQTRSGPLIDDDCHMVRKVFLDDSNQLYCEEPRRNFAVNLQSGLSVQEQD